MSRRSLARAGPWLIPTLAIAEACLVWSGPVSVRDAIVAGAIIEALSSGMVIVCVVAGLRRLRSARAAGVGGSQAAEDAVIAWVVLEGPVVDTVLEAALPGSLWVWVAAGVHFYAFAWLAGLWASFDTGPHRLTR